MCVDPLTAVAIAGTAMSAISSIGQGAAQAQAARYNADVASNQAMWSDYNAKVATQNAAENARQLREQRYRQIGTQRATMGASGVALTGSPLDVLTDSIANTEADAARLIYGGEAEATGLRNQAAGARAQASFASGQAGQATTAGYLGAGTADRKSVV